MKQVTYESEASPGLGADDVFDIISKSVRNNGDSGLSGFLIFAHNRFFQVIEGPAQGITDLMDRLSKDARHHSITILDERTVDKLSFSRWRMKRFVFEGLDDNAFLRIPSDLASAPAHVRQAANGFLRRARPV
ncbi:hypothetical protein CD351_07615 [Erythrobacter sp. KY5]|uniref:BLUF domain-containing protein n=1 Tax=Erythrobacter sp. KY5 TaxID=2011159 RepID=UPI000DBF0365|nr:BLUF domain-containing protein [Erythrobacter sp. KY5]AWW74293.1 hypothetical protein CD351_07615 [Erythrobacter sp. KY5]